MTVWTEELIEKNIFELREKLHIEGDRMPTHQEMKDNKLSGLGAAISKNGGIDFWSKKLGLNVITAGEKNTKWTDKAIAEGILSVMDALTLDRMPTRVEIVSISGNGLAGVISKSALGYYGWAGKLGLESKNSETSSGKKYEHIAEEHIVDMYQELTVKQMTQNYPFDILIDDTLKIDVKVGKRHTHFGTPSYTFATNKKYASCDLYLCYGLGEDGEIADVYLIPSNTAITTTINITIGGKSKYDKYKNQWQLIGRLLAGIEEALAI